MRNYSIENELKHYGILGMKWGVRRYQNKDGTLTPAGKKRVKNYDSAINEKKKKVANAEREVKDIKKKGMNSETVRGIYAKDKITEEVNEMFGGTYVSTLPKVRMKMDAKGNITEISGLNSYKVISFLAESIDERESTIRWSQMAIKRLEKKRSKLVGESSSNQTPKKSGPTSQAKNQAPKNKPDLTTRFESARKENPTLTYNTIYNSKIAKTVLKERLNKGDNRETILQDTSYYKEIEDSWLKENGF